MAEFTTRPVIMGTHGVVTTGHYLATEIGMRVLNAGGNAIDAGVAAGFALNLLKPHANGIGGESPILIHRAAADGPQPVAVNGQGSAPQRAPIESGSTVFHSSAAVISGAINAASASLSAGSARFT